MRALCAVGAALVLVACSAEPGAPPNIVLVYADDLGWRDLGVQGSGYYETPHLDRLASEGVRFTDAYANAPNCAPSRAALLSGQYAPRTGIYTVASAARGSASDRALIPVENRTTLALDVVTLAETLGEAGYVTGHAGKWHLGGDGFLPEDQGFDWAIAGDERGAPPGYFFPYVRGERRIPDLDTGVEGEYLTDRLVDESLAFIEREQDRPFFLYLSHYGVHTPIQGKDEIVRRYEDKAPVDGHGNATYAAMIESVDDGVGRLMETLDRLGLSDNTVVIFTSDNGGYGPATSMEPLRGSKGMLYEGGVRVPLLVRWPENVPPGAIRTTPVIGTDLYPTLAAIADAPLPPGQPVDGVSLLPLLEDPDAVVDRDLFWHFPAYLEADRSVPGPWRTTPASAIRRGRHKLVHFFEGDRWELYDLEADISESRDLSSERPGVMRELRGALEEWWIATNAHFLLEPNPLYDPAGRGVRP